MDGTEVSETFPTEAKAIAFRGRVDASDQQYPVDPVLGPWIPHRGFLQVTPIEPGELTLREWFPRAIAARPKASPALNVPFLALSGSSLKVGE